MNERPKDCDSCRFKTAIPMPPEPDEPSDTYCGSMVVNHTYIIDAKRPPCGGLGWRPH